MLVLSRKCDEAVVFGGFNGGAHMAKVTVLEISGGSVRLGFEANIDVLVYREEVWVGMRANQPRDPPTSGLADRTSDNTNGKTGVLSGGGKSIQGQEGVSTRKGDGMLNRTNGCYWRLIENLDRWENDGGRPI